MFEQQLFKEMEREKIHFQDFHFVSRKKFYFLYELKSQHANDVLLQRYVYKINSVKIYDEDYLHKYLRRSLAVPSAQKDCIILQIIPIVLQLPM